MILVPFGAICFEFRAPSSSGRAPVLHSGGERFESAGVHPIEFPRENASALRAVMGSSARKEKGVLKSTESALARKWRFEPMVFKKVFISSNFFEEARFCAWLACKIQFRTSSSQ